MGVRTLSTGAEVPFPNPGPSNPLPTTIIAMELMAWVDGTGHVRADFTRGWKSLRGAPTALATVVGDICGGNNNFLGYITTKWPDPVSLSNDDLAYVVLSLPLRDEWEFSENGDPFSLSSINNFNRNYYDPQKYDYLGNTMGDGVGCKVASFIADSSSILTAINNRYLYREYFNLRLERVTTTAGGSTRKFYLVDPDIRYPGGTDP